METSDTAVKEELIGRIKFLVDKLSAGYIHPCSVQDIKKKLMELPVEHLSGIRRVRLSCQKNAGADASYFEGTIKIYAVPEDMKFVYHFRPPEVMQREYSKFGARWEKLGDCWYCYWRLENFKKFILDHVLLHELGHHVDAFHAMRQSAGRERFAETYAIAQETKIREESETSKRPKYY